MSDCGHVLHPEFHESLHAAWQTAAGALQRYADALAMLDAMRDAGGDAGPAAVAAHAELLDALRSLEQISRTTCRPAGWHPRESYGAAAPWRS